MSPLSSRLLRGSVNAPLVANRPISSLTTHGDIVRPYLEDRRVLFVGAGAGPIALGSYMAMRGMPDENMIFADNQGVFGGIWNHKHVQDGGFNNPAPLRFGYMHYRSHHLDTYDRQGHRMRDFLREIADDFLHKATLIGETIVGAERQAGIWTAATESGTRIETDYLVLATGTPHPRRINGSRFTSNLDIISQYGGVPSEQLVLERHQRKLTGEELGSDRPIVLIGLGNSTAAMLKHINDYELRTDQQVDYTIVTDLPREAVENPSQIAPGRTKPLYRSPRGGHLTGYSGDLYEDKANLEQARRAGKVITDVGIVNFKAGSGELWVASEGGAFRSIKNPHVFALLGYERDTGLFKSIGADLSEQEEPDIRPSDGAVWTAQDGYVSNVFAIGACARGPDHPNAATIPGIFGQVPATSLAMSIRSAAHYGGAGDFL